MKKWVVVPWEVYKERVAEVKLEKVDKQQEEEEANINVKKRKRDSWIKWRKVI